MKKFFRYLTPLLLILVVGITAAWAGDRINSDRQILPENLSHVSFAGADGSSCEKAVVIRNAANNGEGVAAEKAWVTWKYPNAKLKGQAVSGAGNKTFDTLEIETADGEPKTVCFDITDFFGQW
ncbi:MAG TPA: hypothetical protein PKY50_00490 [Candidatus Competibacter sp.]|nr:hypothetical protein [Candidatus Competibacter sp.]